MPNIIPITSSAVQTAAVDWLHEVRIALDARHWIAAARLAVVSERETLDDETARAFAAEVGAQTIDAGKAVERFKTYVGKRDALTEKANALAGGGALVEARIAALKGKRRDLVVAVLKDQIAQLTDAAKVHSESREAIVARRDALLDELRALEPPPGGTTQQTASRRAARAARKTAARKTTARKAATRKAARKAAGPAAARKRTTKKRARRARTSAAPAALATP
jgi:hypothetical protein